MSTEVERTAAAAAILARHGVPVDVQELLLRGDGRGVVPPGVLAKVLSTARAEARKAALEEAAKVAFNTQAPKSIGRDHGRHHQAGAQAAATAIRALIEHESKEG